MARSTLVLNASQTSPATLPSPAIPLQVDAIAASTVRTPSPPEVDRLILVLAGNLTAVHGCQRRLLRTGAACLLPAAGGNTLESGPRGARIAHGPLDSPFVRRLPPPWCDALPHVALQDPTTQMIVQRVCAELDRCDALQTMALASLATDALMHLLRHTEQTLAAAPDWLGGLAQRWRDDPAEPLSIAAIAFELGLTAEAVARRFQRHFGVSLPQYVLERRVEWACQRLREEDVSLARLAREAGFEDPSDLIRGFRKVLGMTPGAWRERT